MPQQPVNVGVTANNGGGDPIRTAYIKLNANDAELYALINAAVAAANGKQPLSSNLTALSAGTILGVGTGANYLAAGNDSRIVGALQASVAATTYAPLNSPNLTGTPTAPSPAVGTNTNQIATAAMVTSAVAGASGGGGTAVLYTTQSLTSGQQAQARSNIGAAASGANTDISSLASPALNSATATTQAPGDNSTKVATTAFVAGAVAGVANNTAVPTRQTAISGPSSAGAPSFLPATTSGTLTLAAQNVSASVPLIVTAAQGGLNNATYTFTSNPSWTLTASATNFLFVNTSTGATSASTLAPIYQFGGTISTASGQFTFDWQAMVGYLGNGSTAVATPLVCVGEAVTSASAVTSTVAYAYQGRYQSGAVAYSAGTGNYAFNHNIGVPIEFLQIEPYARSPSNTGAWTPNVLAVGSTGYPMAALLGGVSRLTIKLQPGGSGPFYDSGTQTGSSASSGDLMVRVRRAF